MNAGSTDIVKVILMLITLNAVILLVNSAVAININIQQTETNLTEGESISDSWYFLKGDILNIKNSINKVKNEEKWASAGLDKVVFGAIEAAVNFVLFINMFFTITFRLIFGTVINQQSTYPIEVLILSSLNFITLIINLLGIRHIWKIITGR